MNLKEKGFVELTVKEGTVHYGREDMVAGALWVTRTVFTILRIATSQQARKQSAWFISEFTVYNLSKPTPTPRELISPAEYTP